MTETGILEEKNNKTKVNSDFFFLVLSRNNQVPLTTVSEITFIGYYSPETTSFSAFLHPSPNKRSVFPLIFLLLCLKLCGFVMVVS